MGVKPKAGWFGGWKEEGRRRVGARAPGQGARGNQRRARAPFIVSSGISWVTSERFPCGAEPTT